MSQPKGYIIYQDYNRVAILTRGSRNPKTGNMDQVWILHRSMSPLTMYKNGFDSFICGDCQRRSKPAGGNGSCYVQIGFAPEAVHKAYLNNKYININSYKELVYVGKNRDIRLGAYGDPVNIPLSYIKELLSQAKSWTGYTHAWKQHYVSNYKKYLMASVDNESEAIQAQEMGWRTFRVYNHSEEAHKTIRKKLNEAICPSSKEAGNKLQCIDCPNMLRCNGGTNKYNILIKEH